MALDGYLASRTAREARRIIARLPGGGGYPRIRAYGWFARCGRREAAPVRRIGFAGADLVFLESWNFRSRSRPPDRQFRPRDRPGPSDFSGWPRDRSARIDPNSGERSEERRV